MPICFRQNAILFSRSVRPDVGNTGSCADSSVKLHKTHTNTPPQQWNRKEKGRERLCERHNRNSSSSRNYHIYLSCVFVCVVACAVCLRIEGKLRSRIAVCVRERMYRHTTHAYHIASRISNINHSHSHSFQQKFPWLLVAIDKIHNKNSKLFVK